MKNRDIIFVKLIKKAPLARRLSILQAGVICPLQSGPKVNLDWTLKEIEDGQEARA
jgi:hypothetical protein